MVTLCARSRLPARREGASAACPCLMIQSILASVTRISPKTASTPAFSKGRREHTDSARVLPVSLHATRTMPSMSLMTHSFKLLMRLILCAKVVFFQAAEASCARWICCATSSAERRGMVSMWYCPQLLPLHEHAIPRMSVQQWKGHSMSSIPSCFLSCPPQAVTGSNPPDGRTTSAHQ